MLWKSHYDYPSCSFHRKSFAMQGSWLCAVEVQRTAQEAIAEGVRGMFLWPICDISLSFWQAGRRAIKCTQ